MMDNDKKSLPNTKKRRIKKGIPVKKILLGILIFFVISALSAGGFLYYLIRELPSIASLKDYRPSIITRVYSDNGELIDEFYLEDRKVIRVTDLPKFVTQAFVAAEDARFFQHSGVDLHGIARAFLKNLEAGTIVQGGSTITQQVAKSLFLTPEKSYIRKLKEAVLAYKIDKYLKKYEILNLYLNHIYLGHGAYGIEAASERYFGKGAKELTLPEAALLAGLPKAPNRYSPDLHPKRARMRQAYVLNRMAEDGYITDEEKTTAMEASIELKSSPGKGKIAPYFTENIRRYIQSSYGSEVLYQEGLEVYTTLNVAMQKAAREAVKRGLRELDKRQGYRGALRRIPEEEFDFFLENMNKNMGDVCPEKNQIVKALVVEIDSKEKIVRLRTGKYRGIMSLKNMSWARAPDPDVAYNTVKIEDPADVLNVGDVVEVRILNVDNTGTEPQFQLALEQEPLVQGALLCMDVKTGQIKAMVGGRDYKKSEFNRATQSRRQPGSAFKPFIYAAAFDKGMTPATIIMDTPIIFKDTLKDSTWKPHNYEEKFYGPTTMRTGLIKSRNLVTIKVLNDIGINYAADYASNMGIASPLARDLSLALGSSGVTLEEIVRAYGVFANKGKKVTPYLIRKIVDRTNHIFEEHKPEVEQVIDPRIAFITTHLLQEVVQSGTGWRVRELNRPVAGKTGTTNDLKDAWFIGFTPSLVTGTWVGYDNLKPLGKYETGSRAASPIFLYFMKKALEGKPVKFFSPPEGVVFAKIDPKTGLLASPDSKKSTFECFLEGTAPTEYTPSESNKRKKGFFESDLDEQHKQNFQE
ncbi:MAG: PBP1A family penicillin-binding protein [Syntrophobacterales bacterium]|nr:PBP1A family penicillin-binding protein [Syntrophobacterales bacterium]